MINYVVRDTRCVVLPFQMLELGGPESTLTALR